MLVPSHDLCARNVARFPNESAAYRTARNALLTAEIDLRRQAECVAEQRRSLPPGGVVNAHYAFDGADGRVTLDGLFGHHDTLVIYSFMYGPERTSACPMCTSLMNALELKVADIEQRVALAMVARAPLQTLLQAKADRGWTRLKVYSDTDSAFTRDYIDADLADIPGYTVFQRGPGGIRHFWSAEMSGAMADPGQDPRGSPELDSLWHLLDTTPHGRGDWYPCLAYAAT